jgi:hypothetical protein
MESKSLSITYTYVNGDVALPIINPLLSWDTGLGQRMMDCKVLGFGQSENHGTFDMAEESNSETAMWIMW